MSEDTEDTLLMIGLAAAAYFFLIKKPATVVKPATYTPPIAQIQNSNQSNSNFLAQAESGLVNLFKDLTGANTGSQRDTTLLEASDTEDVNIDTSPIDKLSAWASNLDISDLWDDMG